jgi:hypothetical protein
LVVVLLALTAITSGCVGTTSRNLCVDSASSSGESATVKGEGATFTYRDPRGLVNSNWQNPGVYLISVDNNVVTQTLTNFTYSRECGLVGGS